MAGLILYSYFRSSAAYRVRIGLHLKGLEHAIRPVHLLRDGGENERPEYRRLNPIGLLPTLVDGERVLTQSLAILEYLEERWPRPPLLPADPYARAEARAMAQLVACEIHPLNNLRVGDYLRARAGLDEAGWLAWYRHWVGEGLAALERMVAARARPEALCVTPRPGIAEACLVPQLYNARRYGCGLEGYPELLRIEASCLAREAFRRAAPECQPDAE